MTYIPVQGGLGNQLFILAMAHHVNKEYGHKVVLTFQEDEFNRGHRDNYLPEFMKDCNHEISISSGKVINVLLKIVDKVDSKSPRLAKILKDVGRIVDIKDPNEYSSPKIKNARIVRGFFQSVLLVNDVWSLIESEIKTTLTKQRETLVVNSKASEIIESLNFQCIHIRRGDYLENKKTIGVLTQEYFYQNAKKELPTIITTDTFSDAEFCNRFAKCMIFDQNEVNPLQSLALMSFSREFVMSNSTLSWWGSRMVLENGGTVIAPKPWFITSLSDGPNSLSDERFQIRESIFEV